MHQIYLSISGERDQTPPLIHQRSQTFLQQQSHIKKNKKGSRTSPSSNVIAIQPCMASHHNHHFRQLCQNSEVSLSSSSLIFFWFTRWARNRPNLRLWEQKPQISYLRSVYLLLLGGGISLGSEVGRGRTTVKVPANQGLEERVEDDLSTAKNWVSRCYIWIHQESMAYLVWGRASQRTRTNLKI